MKTLKELGITSITELRSVIASLKVVGKHLSLENHGVPVSISDFSFMGSGKSRVLVVKTEAGSFQEIELKEVKVPPFFHSKTLGKDVYYGDYVKTSRSSRFRVLKMVGKDRFSSRSYSGANYHFNTSSILPTERKKGFIVLDPSSGSPHSPFSEKRPTTVASQFAIAEVTYEF